MGNVRGDARREALRTAAAQVLVEQGFGALTHRAVSARAGVPLASTTYYFASVEDLAEQALREATRHWLDASRRAVEALPAELVGADATARALIAVVTAGEQGPGPLTAMYERFLEAGRRPDLRPLVVAANDDVVRLLGQVLHRAGLPADEARLVLATVDGLLLAALAEGSARPGASVQAALSRLVGLLPRG